MSVKRLCVWSMEGRPGDQWATVPRTMACPVTRTPWRLPGTESRRLGDVSVTPPVAMMDWLLLTKATYGREECSSGLRALEFSPSYQGRQRQGLEAGCHVASALEEQSRWLLSSLPSHSPGRSSAQRGGSSRLDWPNEGNHDPSQVCPALLLGDSRNCQGDINCHIW